MNNHFAVLEISSNETIPTDSAVKRFFKTENIDVTEMWTLECLGSDGYMLESLYYKIEHSHFTSRTAYALLQRLNSLINDLHNEKEDLNSPKNRLKVKSLVSETKTKVYENPEDELI